MKKIDIIKGMYKKGIEDYFSLLERIESGQYSKAYTERLKLELLTTIYNNKSLDKQQNNNNEETTNK